MEPTVKTHEFSVRDLFAAIAISGILARLNVQDLALAPLGQILENSAEVAYRFADQMIEVSTRK